MHGESARYRPWSLLDPETIPPDSPVCSAPAPGQGGLRQGQPLLGECLTETNAREPPDWQQRVVAVFQGV